MQEWPASSSKKASPRVSPSKASLTPSGRVHQDHPGPIRLFTGWRMGGTSVTACAVSSRGTGKNSPAG
jgi:hypothetical protein